MINPDRATNASTSKCSHSFGDNYITKYFMSLPTPDTTQLEYVWIDGFGTVRSKTKSLLWPIQERDQLQLKDIPFWNFDGSSTGQASGENSEVYLRPVKMYKDPFRAYGTAWKSNNWIILCETVTPDLVQMHPTNTRRECEQTMNIAEVKIDADPWFGFEMEFFIMDPLTNLPIGFPASGEIPEQGRFYCAANTLGRNIIECHYKACLYAGIHISGVNAEVACGQWEYQVFGKGIDAPDDAWMTRYILDRVCEQFNVTASWHPKPIKGDCNGSGMHTNFSTASMRREGGLVDIEKAIDKLSTRHMQHIAVYGEGNELRLTGTHETASIDEFTWGYGNRKCSVRVGHDTARDGCGYFEDRRPASSCDMYKIAEILVKTILLPD